MRRIIKPFTVETRHGARKAPSTAKWPQLDEQPNVEWLDVAVADHAEAQPVPAPQPSEPSRRVLPALDQIVQPAVAAPYRDPRRKTPVVETAPDLEPEPETTAEVHAEPEAERVAEPVLEVADDEPVIVTPVTVNLSAVAATIPIAKGRKRLGRDAFSRGERWKARLPAAVPRAEKKRARRTPGR